MRTTPLSLRSLSGVVGAAFPQGIRKICSPVSENWYYTYFRRWSTDGTLLALHDELYLLSRWVERRSDSPSELIVDSQSVKTAAMIAEAVGYDAAQKVKGRKRHLTIDTLGLVLRVLVSAADVPEREGGKRVLKKVKQMGAVRRVHTAWVDGG